MRVRQVYRDVFSLVPGGIERHVRDLAGALSAKAEVEVVGAARRPWPRSWREDGVAVRVAAEFGRVGGVPLAPGLALRVAFSGVDVVHHHGPNPTGELALPLNRRTTVATWHCDPHRLPFLQPAYAAAVAATLGSCQRVLVSSEALLEHSPVLRRLVDRRSGLVQVVPFGIDVTRFSPAAAGDRPRGGSAHRPVVLFVGRLRAYKGLEVLVRAFRDLDATLVVVGDGPKRQMLESFGASMLGDRLRMLGSVPDEVLPSLYRSADVLCLPSTTEAEAFGIVLLEAMASGVPVVSTEVGTATSVVNRHGETGLVVPPGDPEALGSALAHLLGDPDRAAAMGRHARDHVLRNHDLSVMADTILGIYQDVQR